ncbi:MAG: DinB family protein, partial [Solirubrobacteraceae bacterium]|nr:DinB family protein [Solirubrobacteraceae bacterium]
MTSTPARAGAGALPELLRSTRERTLELTAAISDEDLERQIDPIMSPLVWDIAHIAAYEDLWLVHRGGGKPLLRPDLAALYDAVETPRAVRGEIAQLNAPQAREYLAAVRERALELAAQHEADAGITEMVLRHELQHRETI